MRASHAAVPDAARPELHGRDPWLRDVVRQRAITSKSTGPRRPGGLGFLEPNLTLGVVGYEGGATTMWVGFGNEAVPPWYCDPFGDPFVLEIRLTPTEIGAAANDWAANVRPYVDGSRIG